MIDDRIFTLKVLAWQRHPLSAGIELAFRGYDFKEGIYDIKSIEWEEVEPGKYLDTPFYVSHDTAQELMNSLWECGLRPAQGAGSAGQLETMKFHLEDMRKIAFNLLKIK